MKQALSRVLILLLLLTLLISAASCSKSNIEVPDGMLLCSDESLEYCFFVPAGWLINDMSGTTSAYRNENGSTVASVTVTTHAPSESMTVEGYWALCEESYKSEFKNYAFVSGDPSTVAELNAMTYVYTAEFSGVKYKFNQTIFIERSRFYIITYTATEESYDAYLDHLAQMKSEIYFR